MHHYSCFSYKCIETQIDYVTWLFQTFNSVFLCSENVFFKSLCRSQILIFIIQWLLETILSCLKSSNIHLFSVCVCMCACGLDLCMCQPKEYSGFAAVLVLGVSLKKAWHLFCALRSLGYHKRNLTILLGNSLLLGRLLNLERSYGESTWKGRGSEATQRDRAAQPSYNPG